MLKTLHKLGLDSTDKVSVGGVEVSPRDVVAACLPDPASLGDRMTRQDLRRAVGHRHRQGRPAARDVPVPRGRQRVVDAGVRLPGVVWQTAINPVIALELLADGTWSGAGVLGPEALRRRARSSTC